MPYSVTIARAILVAWSMSDDAPVVGILGRLAPNALVDENEVARNLGMSRTPVREALLRLQNESLVEIARGRGIRVLPLSAEDMRETYQAISGLEVVAVRLVAERRPTRADLEPLFEAVEDMRGALVEGDVEAWGEADERFHRLLLSLSGNRKLDAVGRQLRDYARRAHMVAVRLQPDEYKARSTERHAGLLDELLNGDPQQAWITHAEQRRRGEDALVGIVKKLNLHSL